MKTYTFAQLKKIVQEQGYKLAALENSQGEKIVSFNQLKVSLDKQFKTIETRLKSELHPDGVYFVLLAHSISKTKTPDRYPITKGKVDPETLKEVEKKEIPLTPSIVYEKPDVLTYDKAFDYIQQIAKLESRVAALELENAYLLEEIEDVESKTLSEGEKPGGMGSFLQEMGPHLLAAADKYFSLEEKKLDLQMQKKKSEKKPSIAIGSQEHINTIYHWYNSEAPGADKMYNLWMDKLEAANPDLYAQVLDQLEGEEEEEEQEGPEQ